MFKICKIVIGFVASFHFAYSACFFDLMSEQSKDRFLDFALVYDIIFGLEIVTNFFTEHHYPASHQIERDLVKLFWIYFKGRLLSDLATLVPFFALFSNMDLKKRKLLFLFKLLRLRVSF